MYPNSSSNLLDEEEISDQHVPIVAQDSILAGTPLDPGIVYDSVVSQKTLVPPRPHLNQAWDVPSQLNTSQQPDALRDGVLDSDAQIAAFVDQLLHQQTSNTMYSSLSMSAVYPEALTRGVPPISDEIDISFGNTFTVHPNQYDLNMTPSPHNYHHTNDREISTGTQQPIQSFATYLDEKQSSAMSMSTTYPYTITTTKYNQNGAGMHLNKPGFELEPSNLTVSSNLLLRSDKQNSISQNQNDDLFSQILNADPHLQREKNSNQANNQETMLTEKIYKHVFYANDMKSVSEQISGSRRKDSHLNKGTKASTAVMKRPKPAPVSRQTACWRCRRYKKPCTGKGTICNSCITSGFRIWSSDIGCHRGDMAEFVLMLLPPLVEQNPIKIDVAYPKPSSFRQTSKTYSSDTIIPISAVRGDIWDKFLYKVQCTGIHGPGILELLQIAVRHQRKLKKPDKVIVSAIRAMSIATDMFRLLVATKGSDVLIPALNLTDIFTEARTALTLAAGCFLRNCLTGRFKQWFTTFIASNINVFAYIFIGDAINALPEECRATVWPDLRKTLLDLRKTLYPTAKSLLNALSKGSQPLDMLCWEMVQDDTGTYSRNTEGMRLVDDCEATFDAMRDLQLWRERFTHLLHGDVWMSNQPLAVDLLLISSVSRLYITSKA